MSQSYEFDANSNYNQDVGLRDYMSDLLGNISYSGNKNSFENFQINSKFLNEKRLEYLDFHRRSVMGNE